MTVNLTPALIAALLLLVPAWLACISWAVVAEDAEDLALRLSAFGVLSAMLFLSGPVLGGVVSP